MSNEPTIDRLSAYLDDELSPDEREVLENQLSASEPLREQLEKLRQVKHWFEKYPGRKPQSDAWPGIVRRIAGDAVAPEPRWNDERQVGPTRRRLLTLIPGFGTEGMSTAAKRIGIGALIALALGGMGRQVVLQQSAAELERANTLRDLQLLKYVNENRWNATASNLRGEIGRRVSVVCPPAGQPAPVWGAGLYTDDSGICTAGVHSGAITLEDGGLVTIEIRPGASEYRGTVKNGIESGAYESWGGSYVVVRPDQDRRVLGLADMNWGIASWDASAVELRGLNGTLVSLACPPNGEDRGPIWGTDVYTDDSSICAAAVHAGVISFEDGGEVTIEIVPGQPEYRGTTRNGIESLDYPDWSGSFVFVPDETLGGRHAGRANPSPRPGLAVDPHVSVDVDPHVSVEVDPHVSVEVDPNVLVHVDPDLAVSLTVSMHLGQIDWDSNAIEMSDWVGVRTKLTCPPDGHAAPVWGTETYTDGSSICTAAVHSGLITFEDGGEVTIEILPGRSSYPGSRRNGVSTSTFTASEEWPGSFRFVDN